MADSSDSRPFQNLRSMIDPASLKKEAGLPFGGKKKLKVLQQKKGETSGTVPQGQPEIAPQSAPGPAAPVKAPAPVRKKRLVWVNDAKDSSQKPGAGSGERREKPKDVRGKQTEKSSTPEKGRAAQRQIREAESRMLSPEVSPGDEPRQKKGGAPRRNEKGEIIRNPVPPFSLTAGLPVSEHGEELVRAVRENPVIIVCGETGSGKTTQLPKICLMAGRGTRGLIGHTQPRRIAASSVAKRIAEELKTPLGEVVGYKVRFTDETDAGASIKLMTDGILLAETQGDPLLKKYDTIIIDEAHERSINIDFLLGYLKRLLAKRRDLKVIVTSATIDSERFAKHFADEAGKPAPVFTISGRTYPVEIRYRPHDDEDESDDKTLMQSISDAVDELEMAGRGDILVFLPGEREIHEAAEVLRRSHKPGTVEILPLFARLSVADQEKVFRSGGVRRIVLATNVAETSVTVPAIRYVVDTGLARVKRYSYRNKVEQLLVEPVSQASANQRAGRCGRVAAGICIRLYDELSFNRRGPFTDPEILRSNLAAVILRMKALRLGEVRDFPFVQAPPPRAISDGYNILAELGAIDEDGVLTEVGKTLARLPVDPRLSRILLAAHENGALREALIIVSGLAIQDPRERPLDAQEAAGKAHKVFADESSDFMAYVNMWNWFVQANAQKESNSALTREMHRRYLSARRFREWRDVWRQLGELTRECGWVSTAAPATYEQLHTALLTGLLGNLGNRQLDADFKAPPYLGARGIHFWVWPGSALAKKGGKWIMAAQLVETSRLFARCVAQIEPEWIERVAPHLIKKSWTEPHWEKNRGEVVALERGALYGLTVYAQRRVGFARHDAALCRELFIREALVGGDIDLRAPFLDHNRRLIADIRDIENKARRPDVLVDEERIFAFYDEKLPAEVVGQVTFETWRKEAEKTDPKRLFMKREELMRRDADGVTADFFPKNCEMAGLTMALTYHFEPGSARDGVTMTVPLYALNQIDSVRCEWLVPGMLREKVQSLVKSLPQKLRRHCVPVADYAMEFYRRVDGHQKGSMSLIDALIEDIREQKRVVCERTDFKTEFLPAHLIMNFKVVDEHGRQLDMGRSLPELKSALGSEAQQLFQSMAQADKSVSADLADDIVSWSFGELPELMEISRKGVKLIGIPALVDCGDHCRLEVFDEEGEAHRAHRAGLRRLFFLQMKEQVKYLQKSLADLQRVQMQGAVIPPIAGAFDSFESLKDDLVAAAVEASCMAQPWPVNEMEFLKRKDEARSRLTLLAQELERLLSETMTALSGAGKKLVASKGFPEAVKDVSEQLSALFPRRFLLEIPAEQLRHYPRYARAVMVRLEKLRNDPGRDEKCRQEIARLASLYYRELGNRKGVADERLASFRWLLEELRVSLFAQELRTPMPVSVKRLTKVWESIRRL